MGLDDHEGVLVRCQEDPGVSVRLYDSFVVDEDSVGFSVDLRARGFQATVRGAEVGIWDDSDLPRFVGRLAADYQGWSGLRTWDTRYLLVEAEHHSRGRVRLAWTLRPWDGDGASWSATVTTWLEAGEQMRRLADDLAMLLPGHDQRG